MNTAGQIWIRVRFATARGNKLGVGTLMVAAPRQRNAMEAVHMNVTATMEYEELQEFMEWRKDRALYERRESAIAFNMEQLAKSISCALDINSNDDFMIVDQAHMSDAWMIVCDVLE